MGSAEHLIGERAAAQPPALAPSAAWTILVVTTLARAGSAVLVLLLLWSVLPAAFGLRSTVVMSGSMAPAVRIGDVVVARAVPPAELRPGTVLLVDDPDRAGRLRLHRFVGMEDGLLRLRGDANPAVDSSPVAVEAVRGAAFLRVPWVGMPLVWAREGAWGPVVATALALSALLLGVMAGRLLPRDAAALDRARPPARLLRGAGTAGLVAGALVVGGAHPVEPGWAAFSARAPAPSALFATGAFPCLGTTGASALAVPPTVAYSFAETAGATAEDVTGRGGTGLLTGSVDRVAGSCAANDRPAVRMGAAGPGTVTDRLAMTSPTTFTLAVWFRTSTPGGMLAGFGSKGDGTPSPVFDRQLVLNPNGTLTFQVGVAAGVTASVTTPVATAVNLADGSWHLAVVTLAGLGPMRVFVDGLPTASATLSLSLTGYTAYLRFGYDASPGVAANPYRGLLAGAALWNGTALSDVQIAALAAAGH